MGPAGVHHVGGHEHQTARGDQLQVSGVAGQRHLAHRPPVPVDEQQAIGGADGDRQQLDQQKGGGVAASH
ncbi:hypothetical protein [Modestobacter italicus]|uniref:hypothetical protein n=1 Tax=Modestobacter italicus (strain DSM 44449 / CECT 9708 / BC 501) TaxID=2732864 RepID=UPI001C96B401|nr:hypothetical protein [Modestobacter italicus]